MQAPKYDVQFLRSEVLRSSSSSSRTRQIKECEITDLYSAFRSEDTEALDAAQEDAYTLIMPQCDLNLYKQPSKHSDG